MRKLVWSVALAALGMVAAYGLARASMVEDETAAWFARVCADQAYYSKIVAWIAGPIAASSLLANIRNVPYLTRVLDFFALNWRAIIGVAMNAGKTAALLLICAALPSCAGLVAAGSVAGGAGATASAVSAVANATSTVANDVVALERNGVTVFRAGCGAASVADGYFQALAPALVVAGKIDGKAVENEKADFAGLKVICDPSNPPADLEEAGLRLTAWAGGLYITLATAR